MSAILRYLAVSGVVVATAAVVTTALVPTSGGGVWVAAGLAHVVQLVAFAALTMSRGSGIGWLVAWGGGTLLRLLAVLSTALWVGASGRFPAAPTLLSLAGFLFLLMLLEPMFLRIGMRHR